MRDTNKGMIEITDAEKHDKLYFSIIKLVLNDEPFTLKFGIVKADYFYIKKIISFRPFEDAGFSPYKYFFSGSYQKDSPTKELSTISVRVEQQKKHKQFEFCVSSAYVANLLWFIQIKEKASIEPLIISA